MSVADHAARFRPQLAFDLPACPPPRPAPQPSWQLPARAGSDDAPPDSNLRGINLARRAAALLAEVVATQEEIGASENLDFARQVHRAATQLAGALRAKPAC